MHKIACVFSFRESTWISCQKIVFNLHKAYEGILGTQIENFDYGPETWGSEMMKLATKLAEAKPDTIIILDHRPHPYYLLKLVLPKLDQKKKPRIIFHVFGDFTLYYADWNKLSELIKDYPVEFIVASDRQKILIDQFLVRPAESHVCPFPVKDSDFSFKPEERKLQRKAWGVSETDVVFTFTGRISRQKRTHLLLKCFAEAVHREGSTNSHLFIYGQDDHIGDNFLNIWENENEYFRKVHRIYLELPESTRSRIHFMGNVPNAELRPVYAGADYLVNLSVHNDEDFGMSVAEAQMTGLPAILSDWGGLSSFEHPTFPEATRFVSVRIGQKSKVISKEEVIAALGSAMKAATQVDRKKLRSLANDKLSIETGTRTLASILERPSLPFTNFSEFHQMITRRMQLRQPVYLTKEMKIHPIYRKIYSSYVRNP